MSFFKSEDFYGAAPISAVGIMPSAAAKAANARIKPLLEALKEAEAVIKNHSSGVYHCNGNWDLAKKWLSKYGSKK